MSDMATAEPKPRKITVDEYRRMAEEGILGRDERLELLEGVIVEMSPIGPPHKALHWQIVAYLNRVLGDLAMVGGQWSQPLGAFSEPQPDVILLPRKPNEYFEREARPEEVYAVVEIAQSSLAFDTGAKSELYARFGITEYLVVDIANKELLRYTHPNDSRYDEPERLSYGETFTLVALPNVPLAVDAFLPPGE